MGLAARAAFFFVFLAALVVGAPAAHADEEAVARLEKVAEKAMESFDNFDYEAARKLLDAGVSRARSAGLDTEPILARLYMNLAIVYLSGESDAAAAREALMSAVKIDRSIQIDAAYKTRELDALLDEVKQEIGGSMGPDCSTLSGLSHALIDTAEAGVDRPVEVLMGSDTPAARVVLYYRLQGGADAAEEFTQVPMTSQDQCKYTAVIRGSVLSSGVVHYYVAAFDEKGEEVASKGTERTPNIIEITAGSGLDGDNPLATRKRGGPGGPARLFISVAAGSGAGYVTGTTEQVKAPINCCFAPAALHVFPEVGYFLAPGMSISLAMRLGFPLGANRPDHATAAPAAVLRFRRGLLAQSDQGLYWSAALGGGVIRQTVKLLDQPEGMDVDTSAIGPLLMGGGMGYTLLLGGPARLNAELNMTMGVPVVSELGTAQLNFGVQFDVNVGLMFAF
jgi:hypothetical protein